MLLNRLIAYWHQIIAYWRQSRFPGEIRIEVTEPIDLAVLLENIASALKEARAPVAVVSPLSPEPVKKESRQESPPPQTLDTGFIVELCNECYRVRRNGNFLVKSGAETKEVRSINRAVERMEDALKQRGAEYFEKAGKPFDPRDPEFEPKGQPVAVPGLLQSRIGLCERPVVKLNGKIIQRAQGLIEVPAG